MWQRLPHCNDRRSMAFRDVAEVVASNCEEDTCGGDGDDVLLLGCWEQKSTILLVIVHAVIVEDDDEGDGGDAEVHDVENEDDGTCVVGAYGLAGAKGSEQNRYWSWGSCRVEMVLPGALVVEDPFVLEEQSVFLLGWVVLVEEVAISCCCCWNVVWPETACSACQLEHSALFGSWKYQNLRE